MNALKKIAFILLTIMIFVASTIFGVQKLKAEATTTDEVIQLSIYSRYGEGSSSSNGIGLGHAWLVIENGTSFYAYVYNAVMLPGETFSIGTWGNRKDPDTNKNHNGAWLNLEAYYGLTDNTVSLTITITEEQLAIVSEKCISMNKWDAIHNCSYFASQIWNAVAPSNMKVNSYTFPANYPSTLKNSIQNIDGYQTNRSFAFNDYTGYCTDSTTFKHIMANRLEEGNFSSGSSTIKDCYTSFPEDFNTVEKIQNAYEFKKYDYER